MRPLTCAPGVFVVRALLALAGLAFAGTAAHAQEQLDVGIRSTVVDKPFGRVKSQLQTAKPHGKIYGIVLVKQVKSEGKLVKPVDESAILQLLSAELNTHGYTLVAPGKEPEIVLTVYYGRGFLSNPYQIEGGRTEVNGAASSVTGSGGDTLPAPTVAITGMPTQLFKEMSHGYEAKLQKAGYEKLYIRVAAWAYPSDPKAKARQLWNTTMVVDDPEHRDLNAVVDKMLKAGVAFFDRDITEPEVDVYEPLPEGHVKVGTPEVVPAK